jgi:hypothetical protein
MLYSTPPTGYTPAQVAQLATDSQAFLRKVWPRLQFGAGAPKVDWNSDGTLGNFNGILEGEECLVFFLGGANNGTTFIGFSTDATNPMNPATGRRGPYYQFEMPRVKPGPSTTFAGAARPFFMYADPYGTPYAYFSSINGPNNYSAYRGVMPAGKQHDCFSLANFPPYFQPPPSPTAALQFYNPDTFQIISAGKDGKFGPGGSWSPQSGPSGTAPNGADDLSNFYDSRLGVVP